MDLCRYGGYGYGHVLRTIVPWLRREGVSEEALLKMLVANPRRILTIDWDEDMLARPRLGQGDASRLAKLRS
jgi:hypothetical protein